MHKFSIKLNVQYPIPFFSTRGKLCGGLHGDYQFNAKQLTPAAEPDVPSVVFYSGLSEVSTRRDQLSLIEAGGIDFATGNEISGVRTQVLLI